MEASSLLACSYSSSSSSYQYTSKTHSKFTFHHSSSSYSSPGKCQFLRLSRNPNLFAEKNRFLTTSFLRSSFRSSAFVVERVSENSTDSPAKEREPLPKIDKSGRFCGPRAARELALSIIYAACLEGSDPVRLFERRMNTRREPGYEFDMASLFEYNHMSFGGPPVTTETVEEAEELQRGDEKESAIEAEVLSAPPKLVYSKLLLRFTRKLLVAVVDKWDGHVRVIDKIVPPHWKDAPGSKILELSILHLAMAEIVVLGTRHQIVINEAVDLAKRFCDGAAPRIINGCLRTFVKGLSGPGMAQASDADGRVQL